MLKLLFLSFLMTCCYAQENKASPAEIIQSSVSEDLAHVLWHIMSTYEGEYNFEEMTTTLCKLKADTIKTKPLEKCYSSLMRALEKKATEKGMLNLQSADTYMEHLNINSEFHEIIHNKLYYKIMKPGKSESTKDLTDAPLISFKEKTLDGKILSDCSSGIRIPLSETIPGFQKGLKGIRIGEKREIFIHPDLAYGEFPKPEPFSLIIIEVSLISL